MIKNLEMKIYLGISISCIILLCVMLLSEKASAHYHKGQLVHINDKLKAYEYMEFCPTTPLDSIPADAMASVSQYLSGEYR